VKNNSSDIMLDEVIVTGASTRRFLNGAKCTFSANGETSAGAGSAVIKIEVSNVESPSTSTSGDGYADWLLAGTITLTLATTMASDGFALDAPWRWVRANLTTLSGTDATVSVLKGS
jgi:hypothetical protein